ncbi:MAG: YjgP/YjgQ family permease, partial [Bacteroidota bacterium]
CRKLAESFVVTGTLAGWMPCILLAPVGIFLTIMAMNDRKLISLDGIRNGFDVIRHLIRPDDDNVA